MKMGYHIKDLLTMSTSDLLFKAGLFLVVVIFFLIAIPSKHKQKTVQQPPAESPEKDSPTSAQWRPSTFRPPQPPPYPNWSITNTSPLPYRPFRYGPNYNVTMGLRRVKFEDWIELDNQYPDFHSQKASRILSRGPKCCRTAPEAQPAALELLHELSLYLPNRYPTLFRATRTGIHNLWSGEHIRTTPPLTEDPIQACARLIQDDLAIMIPDPATKTYRFLSGAILLPGFWRLQDKFGKSLAEIHTSGDVPQFREKLEKGMTNLFRRLKPEELVARHNYFIQVDDELAWSSSIGGEDSPEGRFGWDTAERDRAIGSHFYRSERQTLRRLPKTGAIVFTIRTYFLPITELAREKGIPGRLAAAVRSWGDDVSRYKGKDKYARVLLDYLDEKHSEQIERYGREQMQRLERDWDGYPF